MNKDYWDIDQILVTEETVDCTFLQPAAGLGHLDALQASTGVRDVCKSRSFSPIEIYNVVAEWKRPESPTLVSCPAIEARLRRTDSPRALQSRNAKCAEKRPRRCALT